MSWRTSDGGDTLPVNVLNRFPEEEGVLRAEREWKSCGTRDERDKFVLN